MTFCIGKTYYTVSPKGISVLGPKPYRSPQERDQLRTMANDYRKIADWLEEWSKR